MIIILNKNDLSLGGSLQPIDKIEWYHIKHDVNLFERASLVIFTDDNGKNKILKDRDS